MEVNRSGSVPNFQAIQRTQSNTQTDATQANRPSGMEMPQDELEISDEARMIQNQNIKETPEQRAVRVDQIRQSLIEGTYDEAGKLDAAVSRMVNQILDEDV